MTIADYLVERLIQNGVTDVFGIPGGVMLDFLYTIEHHDGLTAHLMYHEQSAAFAAEGFAQSSGMLGCAYATRGPGFTNLITGIADAWQESIPVLFITAHGEKFRDSSLRMVANQEMDTLSIVNSITKYAARVDDEETAIEMIDEACCSAMIGRKGPAFLDFCSQLWNKEIRTEKSFHMKQNNRAACLDYEKIYRSINNAHRPIILIGDGVRHTGTIDYIKRLSERYHIPVLSSRGSQDLMGKSPTYFGYVGSHGIRYANYILAKTDLIFVLGNRLAFPRNSESFRKIIEHAEIIHVDVDKDELEKGVDGAVNVLCDLSDFFAKFDFDRVQKHSATWMQICGIIKSYLNSNDTEYPIKLIAEIMRHSPVKSIFVSDVGNNEFWTSRAYEYANIGNHIIFSKSFGALGNSLPKSIGAFYASRQSIVCFIGDQGMQMNIQELEYIAANKIPILIVLINNRSSGMIRSVEKKKYGDVCVHTTFDSGYATPQFEKIAYAYGIGYKKMKSCTNFSELEEISNLITPCILEVSVDDSIELIPYLPKGYQCQNLMPQISDELAAKIEGL